MSSTILKKVKKASNIQAKQPIAEVDAAPPKERKTKLAKPKERVPNTKSKPAKGHGRKATTAEPARRKLRGPWRAPSSSPPPLSQTSDIEHSHLEENEPEASQEEGGDDDDGPGDENVHLYGFSTDEDSSDDDLDVGEEVELDLGSLPTVARDDATVKRKLEKAKKKPVSLSCSRHLLIAHYDRPPSRAGVRNGRGLFRPNSTRLLRGSDARIFLPIRRDITSPPFAEQEGASAPVLRPTSFGTLKKEICVQTGRSKHYGFVEFASAPVAQVVAETMDNYLLMGHILTCKVIPKDEVHPELWVGANRKWRVVPTYRLAQAQHNKVSQFVCCLIPTDSNPHDHDRWGPLQPRTEMQQRAAEKRLLSRQAARKRKLVEAGIVYNFDKVGYVSSPVRCGSIMTQRTFCSHRKNPKACHDGLC